MPTSHNSPSHASAAFGRVSRLMSLFSLAVAFVLLARHAVAVDLVAGELIQLSGQSAAPNGAWSWFEDERAIIDDSDPDNTLLLVSSVSAGGGSENGDIDLLWLNVDTGTKGHFELHNQLERSDDHNSASLMRRPDGRYLAMYATHNSTDFAYYRVSTSPGDPTAWESTQTIQMEFNAGNGTGVTYANAHHLPNEGGPNGRTYNFSRAVNFDPTIAFSDDMGSTWTSTGAKLVTRPGDDIANRPYARYFADDNRIHVTVTETHPRNNLDNSIYHGYVQDGKLYDSSGVEMDANLFDGNAINPDQLTPIFLGGSAVGGATMTRSWTTDVALDASGRPITVFTARANDSDGDHRLFYAAFDGSSWAVEEIAKMGAGLYAGEDDYTGLASIDPNDPGTVFVSTDIDPRNEQALAHYEIFRGVRSPTGSSWTWDPITFDSTVDNLRPLVPDWTAEETALIWMRGTYSTYLQWNTQVVALTDIQALTELPSLADLDGEDGVTLDDYLIFMSNLHTSVSHLTPDQSVELGDFDGDLDIDYDDLNFFRAEYDLRNGSRALDLAVHHVPEPNSMLLTGLCTIAAAPIRLLEKVRHR